jgi:hypothetical protein
MYIEEALPEFKNEMVVDKKNNPYQAMHALVKITSQKVKEHNYKAVKKCFDIADKLYAKGNGAVKNAVENIYVYSFSTIFQSGLAEKKKLLAIIPMSLYTLYINHLHQHGC